MHTDENKMNFLRRILNMMPDLTVRQAFDLLDAATESFPADADEPVRKDGEWHDGVFFSNYADYLMRSNQKIAAIKEVRKDNASPVGTRFDSPAYFGLRQAKDAVDKRMDQNGYPWYHHQ